jgi:hypothetical protein
LCGIESLVVLFHRAADEVTGVASIWKMHSTIKFRYLRILILTEEEILELHGLTSVVLPMPGANSVDALRSDTSMGLHC